MKAVLVERPHSVAYVERPHSVDYVELEAPSAGPASWW